MDRAAQSASVRLKMRRHGHYTNSSSEMNSVTGRRPMTQTRSEAGGRAGEALHKMWGESVNPINDWKRAQIGGKTRGDPV